VRGWLDEITRDAKRSADLTRQLLAFARRQTIAPVVLDLNVALPGTLRMIQRLVGEDIEIVWRPGSGPMPVKIDPSQLDQVLVNLAVNARDAIGGAGRLALETARTDVDERRAAAFQSPPGSYVELVITGREAHPRLLERPGHLLLLVPGLGQRPPRREDGREGRDEAHEFGAHPAGHPQPGQEEQMQLQMEQSLRQQGLQGKQQLAESESSQKEIMVRGKPASFTITKGQGENSKPRIQVVGSFQGSDGRVLLIVSVDAEKYSEDTITKMIESIR